MDEWVGGGGSTTISSHMRHSQWIQTLNNNRWHRCGGLGYFGDEPIPVACSTCTPTRPFLCAMLNPPLLHCMLNPCSFPFTPK